MQSNSSCQTCKKRRIKCDGAKPICQKCIKSHRTCVEADAAKQQQFAIHIENQYATGEKRRPRGPRSSLIPIYANVDLKTRAHAYYVQNHFQVFQDMPDVVTTWAECLHEWKAEGKTSPIVDLAFSAVALSVFARFQDCRPAAAEASKSYLSLLRHMQNRIPRLSSGNPSSDEIDEYLLGAQFMARYEAFVQNHGDEADLEPLKEVKVWFHIDGAAAILKIWFDNRHRYTPTAIIRQTRRKLIKSCLLREQPLPRWLADGGVFGERDLALEFDHLTIQFIDLYHKYLELKQSSQNGILVAQQVESLVDDFRRLDQEMQEPCDYSQDDFHSSTVSTCAKLGYTAVWNEYYAIRMLVSHTRLQILHLAPQPSSAATLECLSQLGSSADSLASFVPFCLGRIRKSPKGSVEPSNDNFQPYLASLVVWPLSLASGLHTLEPAQRQWFSSALARVSKESSECLYAYAASDYWAVP
ncbi:Zn(2)-C6 fungal-type domain-containing protein [Fusarium keratoplasticum]|nr:Zn(2)-C6 fungal-type domain-containing protein [Fusarium keratoplasticum]